MDHPGTRGKIAVRPAAPDDAESICGIYNHYVMESVATFDIEPVTVEAWRESFQRHVADGPYDCLLAESDSEVLGFVETGQFRGRPAYGTSVTVSVYCSPSALRQGVGSRLYTRLFELLDPARCHRAYAGVTLPNPASVALHTKHGFRHVGTFSECGYKHGAYHDVAWYELAI